MYLSQAAYHGTGNMKCDTCLHLKYFLPDEEVVSVHREKTQYESSYDSSGDRDG